MEIYAELADDGSGMKGITGFLADTFSAGSRGISRYFYILSGASAVEHIFKVACGLDSQILGETQILGQVRSSREASLREGSICALLDDLFREAVRAGIQVRSLTKISQGNVSIGSAAIKMIDEKFNSITDKSVLVIGTGKIGGIICNYLKGKKVKGIFVSNRTYAKACELAARCGGKAVNFSRLKDELKVSDIVVSVTSSPHIILPYRTLSEAMSFRQNRPLLIMDFALPRDVDPAAKNISGVSLYTLDDLTSVVEGNYAKRQIEAKRAENMIRKMADEFLHDNRREETRDLCLIER
jgi:glutamyl-tRNA reductase